MAALPLFGLQSSYFTFSIVPLALSNRQNQTMLDAAKVPTFKQCAEAYIKAHRAGWRNAKHAAQWDATLATYAEPIIGSLPVQAIDPALVMQVATRGRR